MSATGLNARLKALAGRVAILALMTSLVLAPGTAFASGPGPGSQVPGSAVPLGSYPSGAPFYSGQKIEVTIPSNSTLHPGLRVNILECSDPGGSTARLPTSITDCDGSTIQGDTVLINPAGSVSYKKYTVYSLPNSQALGEPRDSLPKCDMRDECVLYIGQNQENFRAPHFFSQPFFVASSRAAALGAPRATSGGAGMLLAIVLPIVAVVILGGGFFYLRRSRRSPAPAGR